MNRILLMLLAVTIFACNDTKKDDKGATPPIQLKLTEKQLGKSNFFISIPDGYNITETGGEDFDVYYVEPIDTLDKKSVGAGIYFGNHPSSFSKDTCKKTTRRDSILGTTETWEVFECSSRWSIQTTISNKGGEPWQEYIHAFGTASNDKDVEKLFYIFATLRKEKKK